MPLPLSEVDLTVSPQDDPERVDTQLKFLVDKKQAMAPGPSRDILEREIADRFKARWPGKRSTAHVSGSRPR